jgi:hypothetical protein
VKVILAGDEETARAVVAVVFLMLGLAGHGWHSPDVEVRPERSTLF